MAGDWLKIEKSTPDKPEIEAIATRLNLDLDSVFGKCFRVWKWFDDHTTDGNAPLASMKSIDRQACHAGFADAMVFVGWLISTEDGLCLPNFDRHNPDTAKQRVMTAQRVAKHRARKVDVTQKNVTRALRQHISADDERTIRTRDGNKCVYCGRVDGQYRVGETKRDSVIALDHVIPVTRGGDSTTDNLVCACTVCNSKKTNKTPDEAGLSWPVSNDGTRYGSVTQPLPREEKRRGNTPLPPRGGMEPIDEFNEGRRPRDRYKKIGAGERKDLKSIQRWVASHSEDLIPRDQFTFSKIFEAAVSPMPELDFYRAVERFARGECR